MAKIYTTVMNPKRRKISGFEIIVALFLLGFSALLLFLFFWGLMSSFRNHYAVIDAPFSLFSDFSFNSWAYLFTGFSFRSGDYVFTLTDMFVNSFLYAFGGALAQTFCTCVVAYVTAKYPSKFSSFINYLVIVVTILPIVGNLPSMIVITRDVLHIYDTLIGTWIMKFGFCSVYYFVFYAAFKRISWEYAEAAFIDGSGHFRVFFTIMLPLTITLFGTVFLLNFIAYWNDFETPYMFLRGSPTLSVGLYGLLNGYGMPSGYTEDITVCLAAAFAVFVPILVLFFALKNKIMGNLMDGGIKG